MLGLRIKTLFVLSILKNLKRFLRWAYRLRLRAVSFTHHKYYDTNGLSVLLENLDFKNLQTRQRFKILKSIAQREWQEQRKKISMDAALEAVLLNPNSSFTKWTAFRLFDIGFISKALSLLEGNLSKYKLTERELNKYAEIKDYKNLLNHLPDVPSDYIERRSSTQGYLLYVTASCLPYHTSGYSIRTHELLLALKASGRRFIILTRPGYPYDRKDSSGTPRGSTTNYGGLQYNHIPNPSSKTNLSEYFQKAASEIIKFSECHQIDTVHAASNYINALPALIAARSLGLKFNYEMRGLWDMTQATKIDGYEFTERYKVGMSLEYFIARKAESVFAISKPMKDLLLQNGVCASKTELLPNCVNIQRFKRLSTNTISDPSIPNICFAGTLNEYEGVDVIIDSVKILVDGGFPVKFNIVGDGPHKRSLIKRTNALKLNKYVKYFGVISYEESLKILSRASIVLITRRSYEVCKIVPPIKVVEAVAIGIPIIYTDLPAIKFELKDYTHCYKLEKLDPGLLADKIIEVSRIPTFQKQAFDPSFNRKWKNYVHFFSNISANSKSTHN